MSQIKTYVIDKDGEEITLAFPHGFKLKHRMTEPVEYGDVVWVSFNRIKRRIVSASKIPLVGDDDPMVVPQPPVPSVTEGITIARLIIDTEETECTSDSEIETETIEHSESEEGL